ncbi:MAG: iron-sulfur cluster-binding domain-containing protein [Bergeyella sp.]|nr:iron-sulfur cluster-binding domain-containing protein [Bergeyella sp.]
MTQPTRKEKPSVFYRLKVVNKKHLTREVFALELEVPHIYRNVFDFESGQYVTLSFFYKNTFCFRDFSITSAPYEEKISLGIKVRSEESAAQELLNMAAGDSVLVSPPKGRFILESKPDESRTILLFSSGIGITPIFSHLKNLLYTEHKTRVFLFYGNKTQESIAYREELDLLKSQYSGRLEIYYFLSRERSANPLLYGRLDEKKLSLIINQILHTDDRDEESTLWDSVDEVLICGKGEMVKTLANACYHRGIPKKNIHFELFETYSEDIYPQEISYPLIKAINIDFTLQGKYYSAEIEDNRLKLLQALLSQKYPIPYSCKSGICGSCECQLEEGEVELLENEYLTEKEKKQGRILVCMSVALSKKIKLNFDLV